MRERCNPSLVYTFRYGRKGAGSGGRGYDISANQRTRPDSPMSPTFCISVYLYLLISIYPRACHTCIYLYHYIFISSNTSQHFHPMAVWIVFPPLHPCVSLFLGLECSFFYSSIYCVTYFYLVHIFSYLFRLNIR